MIFKRFTLVFFFFSIFCTVFAQEMPEDHDKPSTEEIKRGIARKSVSLAKIDQIPEIALNATELKRLHIFQADSLKEVPPQIGKLKNLEILILANTSITGLPKQIKKLKQLKTLVLSVNFMTEIPKGIGQLTELTELTLGTMPVQHIPEIFGKLTKLKKLKINTSKG